MGIRIYEKHFWDITARYERKVISTEEELENGEIKSELIEVEGDLVKVNGIWYTAESWLFHSDEMFIEFYGSRYTDNFVLADKPMLRLKCANITPGKSGAEYIHLSVDELHKTDVQAGGATQLGEYIMADNYRMRDI